MLELLSGPLCVSKVQERKEELAWPDNSYGRVSEHAAKPASGLKDGKEPEFTEHLPRASSWANVDAERVFQVPVLS